MLAETDTSGNTQNEYIFFGGGIARRDSSGNVNYYFANALGTTTITNATGGLCYDADSYPFGGEVVFTNTCGQNYKFAAMEQDSETTDYHTWFRQYSPNEVRWLSPDPLGGDVSDPQSFNRYSYAENNPCNLTDPLGLSTCALDIKLQNKAGKLVDLGSVETEINAILKASSDGQPNSVTANFVTSGKADYTVNIVSGNPNSTTWGEPGFGFINPWVNAAAINTKWGTFESIEVGETAVHELTHRITGLGDLKYNGGPNGRPYMLQDDDYASKYPGPAGVLFQNPTGVILNKDELASFYKKCIKKHGGGGGGGGGRDAVMPTNTGTQSLSICWTTSGNSEYGPYTKTVCSGVYTYGFSWHGFVL